MINIRDQINKRMRELNLNPNQLAKLVEGEISRTHVYEYLRGDTQITDNKLAVLLNVLGLEIRPKW